MKASDIRMSYLILRVFRFHVAVLYPVRPELILTAVLSFRPTDEIYRPERRLDFRLFRIVFYHDISVTNSFACRFDRERRSAPRIVAVHDRVKWKRTFRLIRTGFVIRDIDPLQSKILR